MVRLLCLTHAAVFVGLAAASQSYDMPVVGTNDLAPGGGYGSGSYVYVSHGGTPVVSSATVKFTSDDLDTGSEPTSTVERYARSLGDSDDDAGHIYANQLGGLAVPINIFPQSPHINRGSYRMFETKIYNCMKTGGASSATLKWKFTYSSSSSTRPTAVTYSASFNKGCDDMSEHFGNSGASLSTQSYDMPVVGTNHLTPGGGDGSGSYVYVSHGGTAVVSSATVKFTSDDLDTGTEPTATVEKYARSLGDSDDDAGHIYANQLGGLAVPINIFPQSPHINRGSYRMFETKIYNCMKTGGASSATLKWKFTYSSSSSTRPTAVSYSASFDKGCDDLSEHFGNSADVVV